jgi:hypothetical protein
MTESHPPPDDELSRHLREWRVPEPPARLDARMLATYREGAWKRPSWRLLLTSSVRVPVPVAVGVALLCGLSMAAALRPAWLGAWRPAAEVNAPPRPGPEERRPAPEAPERDLAGFRPAAEIKVTILDPGGAR